MVFNSAKQVTIIKTKPIVPKVPNRAFRTKSDKLCDNFSPDPVANKSKINGRIWLSNQLAPPKSEKNVNTNTNNGINANSVENVSADAVIKPRSRKNDLTDIAKNCSKFKNNRRVLGKSPKSICQRSSVRKRRIFR